MAVVPLVKTIKDSTQVNMVVGMSSTIVVSVGQTPLTTNAIVQHTSAEVLFSIVKDLFWKKPLVLRNLWQYLL